MVLYSIAAESIDAPSRPLGFDMEWRFYWSKGRTVSRRTALVQIGDERTIILVQLSAMTRKLKGLYFDRSSRHVVHLAHRLPLGTQGMFKHTPCRSTAEVRFQRVIESPDIVKLGVNIRGEFAPVQSFPPFVESCQQVMARSCTMTTEFYLGVWLNLPALLKTPMPSLPRGTVGQWSPSLKW